mgnify:CR=1 FL=1
MNKKYKIMGIIGLIALRKSELFYKIMNSLSKEKEISDKDKIRIKKLISNMKNDEFLSKNEKQNKNINPNLRLEDLDIDFNKLIRELKEE